MLREVFDCLRNTGPSKIRRGSAHDPAAREPALLNVAGNAGQGTGPDCEIDCPISQAHDFVRGSNLNAYVGVKLAERRDEWGEDSAREPYGHADADGAAVVLRSGLMRACAEMQRRCDNRSGSFQ